MKTVRIEGAWVSTTTSARTPITRRFRRPPPTVIALSVLFGLLAVGALQGGVAMVRDPQQPLGMSTGFLDRTPIDTYFWPGMFLLGIAAASILTFTGLLFDWRWAWAAAIETRIGHRWPWPGAMATAGVLLVFELLELYIVPFHPIMHPALIIASMVMLGLTLSTSTSEFLRVPHQNPRIESKVSRGVIG